MSVTLLEIPKIVIKVLFLCNEEFSKKEMTESYLG